MLKKKIAALFMLTATSAMFIACVDDSKIDQTNATLTANLDQLKQINKNISNSNDSLNNLGKPVTSVADQFGRLAGIFEKTQDDFAQFMRVGTKASEEMLKLTSTITPENLQKYQQQLSDVLTTFASFNQTFSEKSNDITKLTRQLSISSAMIVKMGRMVGMISPQEWAILEPGVLDVIDSTTEVTDAIKKQAREKILALDNSDANTNLISSAQQELAKLEEIANQIFTALAGVDVGRITESIVPLVDKIEPTLALLERLVVATLADLVSIIW
jgi:ABC-type transporter Mla subunit MlaD